MEFIRSLDFIGYDNYAITDNGRVWSIKKHQWLKPRDNGFGYMQVALYKDGKMRNFKVHKLVALAFLPNPRNLKELNHINEIKSDNRVQNLEWITHKDNINHGTGNQRRAAKLNKKVYCVELDRTFKSVSEAANQLGLWEASISRCCTGKQKTTGKLHFRFVD